jgi:general secretion pathway protein I
MLRKKPNTQGFTLVEVLVAFTVVGIALLAGIRAMGVLIDTSSRQKQILLAQLCIDNALVEHYLSKKLPATGIVESSCTQAENTFTVEQTINKTPNPNFRRVDIKVIEQETSLLQVSTVIGR